MPVRYTEMSVVDKGQLEKEEGGEEGEDVRVTCQRLLFVRYTKMSVVDKVQQEKE